MNNFIQILSSSPLPRLLPLHLPRVQHRLWKMRSFRPEISGISAQVELNLRSTKTPQAEISGGKLLIVRLLSLELFILGVQANKLHFCNLELILNKTGYSHIVENHNFFFIF